MKTKTVVVLSVLAGMSLVVSAKILARERQNKQLNDYLVEGEWRRESAGQTPGAEVALAEKALPRVLQGLSARDSVLTELGERFYSELPESLQRCLPELTSVDTLHLNAASLAGRLGPAGKSAVPLLARLLKDDAADGNAAVSLGLMGSAARGAVPALLTAVADHRPFAATALSEVAPVSSEARAALQAAANSGPEWQRIECAQALRRMGRAGAPLAQNL